MMKTKLLALALLMMVGCEKDKTAPEVETGGSGNSAPATPNETEQPVGDSDAGATAAAGAGGAAGSAGADAGASEAGAGGQGGAADREIRYGAYGYFPSNVTEAEAEKAYEAWKKSFVEDCGTSGLRVKADDPSETLAEGMAYGALLSASWGEQKTFDGLWKYYASAAQLSDAAKGIKSGLMGWRVWSDACAQSQVDAGVPGQSALDMAMALVIASCHWPDGDYLKSAERLIGSIKTNLTTKVADGVVLKTADDEDPACMRPGYFAPGYYRVFASVDEANAKFWNGMADDAYTFLSNAADPTTGLVPEWAPNSSAACGSENDFVGYDAIRTTWRVATDYAWFGESAAKTWLKKQLTWFDGEVGAAQLGALHNGFGTDGTDLVGAKGEANSGYVGALAAGTLAMSQKQSDAYYGVLLDVEPTNDESYHAVTGRALYLLLGANKLSAGCY